GGLFCWAISFPPYHKFTKAGNLVWRCMVRRILDVNDPGLTTMVRTQGYRADWKTSEIKVEGFGKIQARANQVFPFVSTKYLAFSTVEIPLASGEGKSVEPLQTSSLNSPAIPPFSSLFPPVLSSLPRPYSSCYGYIRFLLFCHSLLYLFLFYFSLDPPIYSISIGGREIRKRRRKEKIEKKEGRGRKKDREVGKAKKRKRTEKEEERRRRRNGRR